MGLLDKVETKEEVTKTAKPVAKAVAKKATPVAKKAKKEKKPKAKKARPEGLSSEFETCHLLVGKFHRKFRNFHRSTRNVCHHWWR